MYLILYSWIKNHELKCITLNKVWLGFKVQDFFVRFEVVYKRVLFTVVYRSAGFGCGLRLVGEGISLYYYYYYYIASVYSTALPILIKNDKMKEEKEIPTSFCWTNIGCVHVIYTFQLLAGYIYIYDTFIRW